jgi:hypothetical protein
MPQIIIHSNKEYSKFYINSSHIPLILPMCAAKVHEFVRNANRVASETQPKFCFMFVYYSLMICTILAICMMDALKTGAEITTGVCILLVFSIAFIYMGCEKSSIEDASRKALRSLAAEAEESMKPFYKISTYLSDDNNSHWAYDGKAVGFSLTTNFISVPQIGQQNVVVMDQQTPRVVQNLEQLMNKMPTAQPKTQPNDLQTPLFVCEANNGERQDAGSNQQPPANA